MKPDEKDLLKAVEKWVAKVGRNEAMAALIKRGVGTTTVERLVSGRYDSRPGPMLRTTLAAAISGAEAS